MRTISEKTEVAHTIRSQIGLNALMLLGASKLQYRIVQPGLSFTARILPFNKDGKRSSAPKLMQVMITLHAGDLYDVSVTYVHRGEEKTHLKVTDVAADELTRLMLALDYDGESTLNPRYT